MRGTTYRRTPRTLADLFDTSSGTAPQETASGAANTDALNDPQTRRLYEQLTTPDSVGTRPTVEKRSVPGSIFRALGDAVSTYASIMGRTQLDTHSFQRYLDMLAQQKDEAQKFDERQANAKNAAQRRGAEYLLGAEDRRQMKADERAGRELLQKNALEQKKAEADQRAQEIAADRAAKQQEFDAKKSWDLEMEKTRYSHEQAVAGLRNKAASGDEIAKNDQKKLSEIITHIGGLADVAQVALNGGDPARQIPAMTPDEMNTRVRRLIDAAQVSPEARKAAEDYYNAEMGDVLREFHIQQQNKEMAQDGPDPSMGGTPILERLGRVPTPQRY